MIIIGIGRGFLKVEESCIGVPFLLPSKGIVAILELQDKFMMSFPVIN